MCTTDTVPKDTWAALIDQVRAMVERSGNPDGFDVTDWLDAWLQAPVPALNWQRPVDLLATEDGRRAVQDVLAAMESGAYR